MKMKKTKKIIGIVLAAAVGISSLTAGASVYADSETTSVQKHVVVLIRDMGRRVRQPVLYTKGKYTEKRRSTGKLPITRCRH